MKGNIRTRRHSGQIVAMLRCDRLKDHRSATNRPSRVKRKERVSKVIKQSHKQHDVELSPQSCDIVSGQDSKIYIKPQGAGSEASLIDSLRLLARIDSEYI